MKASRAFAKALGRTGLAALVLYAAACGGSSKSKTTQPAGAAPTRAPVKIGPLPSPEQAFGDVDPELAELGKLLFFEPKLSGDGAISCATCHDPTKGWSDGKPLSKAYPGSEYFRNSKSLLNSAYARYFYWDGRLTGNDRETLVRDSITESHFLNMDGRLMLERLKQIPQYVERFEKTLGGEPSFGRTLKAIAAFLTTVVQTDTPFDRGELGAEARRGMALFTGKAGCVRCHDGPFFSDGLPHSSGLADNPDILENPMRHFTMRSYFKFMGVPGFENVKSDVGFFVVSKQDADIGKFVTPTLRELEHTAPYMHNGTMATLADVVAFYNRGGGDGPNKDPMIAPLGLTDSEQQDLVAFLESLSGEAVIVETPPLLEYETIEDWRSKQN